MSLDTVLIGVGGNALIPEKSHGTVEEQLHYADQIARVLAKVSLLCNRLVVVHGNGPQVGNDLIRVEESFTKVPPIPLYLCDANTQGRMGAKLELALYNAFTALKKPVPHISTLITLVEVDADDPAFMNPSKPIGPFVTRYRAMHLMEVEQTPMVEDSGRGYRRVVPSPKPKKILNMNIIERLFHGNAFVIAGGGGGVPVVRDRDGRLTGTEAVIDKDRTAAMIGSQLKIETFVELTHVPGLFLDFNTPRKRQLDRVSLAEAKEHLEHGQFPPGSMGPKVEAAVEFLEQGGKHALITNAENLEQALLGKAGTWIDAGDTISN